MARQATPHASRSMALYLSLRVVAVASWLVRSDLRQRWRREWDAELINWWDERAASGCGLLGVRLRLARRALVAVPDAWGVRRRLGKGKATLAENLGQDLRFGARALVRQPGFTLVAVLTIALGIAANSTIFSLVNGILLRPLDYPEPDRIVAVWPSTWYSQSAFELLEEEATSYESFAAYAQRSAILIGEDGARILYGPRVTARFFDVLGRPPLLGRTLAPHEDKVGTDEVVILSHGFWQRHFGGDRNAVGQRLRLSGIDRTVIGVMPQGFDFLQVLFGRPEIAFPQRIDRDVPAYTSSEMKAIARLRSGVTREQAQAELRAILAGWREEFGLRESFGVDAEVLTLREYLVGEVRPTLLLLFGAVGFTLLIATANVANLLLARSLNRRREVAMRLALGARPSRLVRQLLTESTLLGILGGVPGLVGAVIGLRAVVALLPAETPRLADVRIDSIVVGFCFLIALVTGWVVGLLPALQMAGSDLREGLAAGGRAATESPLKRRLRGAVVAAEIALAVVLLSGAGLLIKSFWQLNLVDPGFVASGLMTFRLTPEHGRLHSAAEAKTYFTLVEEQLEAIPGVESAAAIWKAPLTPDGGVTAFYPADRPRTPGERPQMCRYRPVNPDYFQTAGIPLLDGRMFDETDVEGSEPVALISRAAADRLFPGGEALGQQVIASMPEEVAATVVGIVGDVKLNGPDEETPAAFYRPYVQVGPMLDAFEAYPREFVLRTAGVPDALFGQVRDAVRLVDANALIGNLRSMPQAISESLADQRVTMILISLFTVTALALAAIGIYGVMAYSVRSRSKDLSIRVALGARRGDVLREVLLDGLKIAAAGAALGLGAALALSRLLQSFVFEVRTTDPWVLSAALVLSLTMAVLATLVPARRAAQADPIEALTAE